ncbi:MAG: hypothetical protein AAGD96_05180 [Chloroflexota bacterium]
MFLRRSTLWIASIIILVIVLGLAIVTPPIPSSISTVQLIKLKLRSDKPSYARCTHHVGLNPSKVAFRTSAHWQTEEAYEQIRQRFLDEYAYDPNLARQDPAWSDYDLLNRQPTTLAIMGFEIMNASTLNYQYVDRNELEVVTSRTIVVCSNSQLVKRASNRLQLLNEQRFSFSED